MSIFCHWIYCLFFYAGVVSYLTVSKLSSVSALLVSGVYLVYVEMCSRLLAWFVVDLLTIILYIQP